MYMGPIVPAKTKAPEAPVAPALHAAIGVVVLLACALVMVPWFTLFGLYVACAFTLRALWHAPRTLAQMVDYAGSVALGR